MTYSTFIINSFTCLRVITILFQGLLICLGSGCADSQEPLVRLSAEEINKFISAGVFNIVFFNENAQPIQILDLKQDTPPEVREVGKKEVMPESMDSGVNQPYSFITLLLPSHAKSLVKRGIPYIEYRNNKDQQIQVYGISKNGMCIPCIKLALQKDHPKQSDLLYKNSKKNILDYVIAPVGATHSACNRFKSGLCIKVDNSCCKCSN